MISKPPSRRRGAWLDKESQFLLVSVMTVKCNHSPKFLRKDTNLTFATINLKLWTHLFDHTGRNWMIEASVFKESLPCKLRIDPEKSSEYGSVVLEAVALLSVQTLIPRDAFSFDSTYLHTALTRDPISSLLSVRGLFVLQSDREKPQHDLPIATVLLGHTIDFVEMLCVAL